MMHSMLQVDYGPNETEQTIRNAEAVPLFFHFLRQSEVVVQTWGLDAFWRLTCGSMPNLSACERCALQSCTIDVLLGA